MRDPGECPSDEQLLAAARQGDGGALETLILRYQPRVYRFGLKMCRNREDAGDVVQETLLAMARSVREFRGDASISTWLYTIARSFCIKKRRRSKFAPPREASLEALPPDRLERLSDPAPDPEQHAGGREIEAALGAAVDSLDAAQREVLVLRDVEGLSAPEVAKVLNISVQAVKDTGRVLLFGYASPRCSACRLEHLHPPLSAATCCCSSRVTWKERSPRKSAPTWKCTSSAVDIAAALASR